MPDVTVATILRDGVDDRFYRVDLIRPHHQKLLLACNQNHVAADRLAERALNEEALGKVVEVDNSLVVFASKLVDRQKSLFGVEGIVSRIIICEVKRHISVTDDEQLQKTQDCFGVTIAGIVLVLDNLLHSSPRADAEGL